MICERCSFDCDLGKYSTLSMNMCEPLCKHLIHWTCAVFLHIARKMNNVCIFSHDQVTYDIILPYTVLTHIFSLSNANAMKRYNLTRLI